MPGYCVPSPLLVLVLVMVMMVMMTSAAPVVTSAQSVACDFACCRVMPNCSAATSVECDCSRHTTVTLQKRFFPKTVHRIVIAGASRVVLKENFFKDMAQVESIQLRDLERLEFKTRSLCLSKESSLRDLTVENVSGSVHVGVSAFSGSWKHRARLVFQSVGHLVIEEHGLSFGSKRGGPKLILRDVGRLTMAGNAFSATLKHVEVLNVGIESCAEGSFGENISVIEMGNVKMNQTNNRCLKSNGRLQKLSFNNCTIKQLKTECMYGSIGEVNINATRVEEFQREALSLAVAHLHVSHSSFGDVPPGAISVTSRESIRWDRVTIKRLQGDAFVNMTLVRSTAQAQFIFSELRVIRAEAGSLAFAEGVQPTFNRPYITLDVEFDCGTESWLQVLLGKHASEPLTEAEQLLAQQLAEHGSCSAGSARSDLEHATNRNETAPWGNGTAGRIIPPEADTDTEHPSGVRNGATEVDDPEETLGIMQLMLILLGSIVAVLAVAAVIGLVLVLNPKD